MYINIYTHIFIYMYIYTHTFIYSNIKNQALLLKIPSLICPVNTKRGGDKKTAQEG